MLAHGFGLHFIRLLARLRADDAPPPEMLGCLHVNSILILICCFRDCRPMFVASALLCGGSMSLFACLACAHFGNRGIGPLWFDMGLISAVSAHLG